MSIAETLRELGMCPSGGGRLILRKYLSIWGISTAHFDPRTAQRSGLRRHASAPLASLLIAGSTYSRGNLKPRLFAEGLKSRECELCGQGEEWRGRPMSLILDHVNGVRDDNRIENLRIVCPNCAATLDTHCGRKNRLKPRDCAHCAKRFQPHHAKHRYCSRACGSRWDRRGRSRPGARKVERPPYEQLCEEVRLTSWSAVGRKYGVSNVAVRKWAETYERELGIEPEQRLVSARNKLGPEQARDALLALAAGHGVVQLATRYGVSKRCIQDLRTGRSHKYLDRT